MADGKAANTAQAATDENQAIIVHCLTVLKPCVMNSLSRNSLFLSFHSKPQPNVCPCARISQKQIASSQFIFSNPLPSQAAQHTVK
jgi:hypothetical protein